MSTWPEQDIREIHDADALLVMAITGGGAQAISTLLTVPGASRTVLEAIVPYHPNALTEFLGQAPEQSCSGATARAMAMTAYRRATGLVHDPSGGVVKRVIGLGCTAALTTDRSRKGKDRCFIALQTVHETREIMLNFNKDQRSREAEDALCADTIISAIRTILALDSHVSCALEPGETLKSEVVTAEPQWRDLLTGQTKASWRNTISPGGIFPGTFNPMHEGHEEMVRVAREMLDTGVALEISIFNVDKAPLDYVEMARRVQHLDDRFPLVFTNAPTFLDKARLFPGKTFIVGVDTILRLASPRYYGNSERRRDDALAEIVALGNRFLVFGRFRDSRFMTLDDVELPDAIRQMCTGVPESRFRVDISSTWWRLQGEI